jgi:hypothetical protein
MSTGKKISNGKKELVFTTRITFVSVDGEGQKKAISRKKGA